MGHPNDDYVNPPGVTAAPPLPPEIFPAELPGDQGGTSSGGDGSPSVENAGGQKPVDEMTREELEAELGADAPTEGSGANNNVVVEDLRKALAAKRGE